MFFDFLAFRARNKTLNRNSNPRTILSAKDFLFSVGKRFLLFHIFKLQNYFNNKIILKKTVEKSTVFKNQNNFVTSTRYFAVFFLMYSTVFSDISTPEPSKITFPSFLILQTQPSETCTLSPFSKVTSKGFAKA